MDEPSTGLHPYDIEKLVKIIHKLADSGNTVLIIEHNLDIIKMADYIIDATSKTVLRGDPHKETYHIYRLTFVKTSVKKEFSLDSFINKSLLI